MSAALAYMLFLLGVSLSAARPLWALAGLVGFVCVTPSLPWQLGLMNLNYPLAYGFGVAIGSYFGEWSRGADGGAWSRGATTTERLLRLRVLSAIAALTVIVPSVLQLARVAAEPVRNWPVTDQLGELLIFNPRGAVGAMQVALVALLGPLLFRSTIVLLSSASRRGLLRQSFLVGVVLVLLAPLLQWLFLDPTVRPDKGMYDSDGIVGFFQDEHSFAAYLVLAVGILLGSAQGWRAKNPRLALALAALAVVCVIEMLFTGSRSGLAAIGLAVVGFLASNWAIGRRRQARVMRQRLRVVAIACTLIVLAVATLYGSDTLRSRLYGAVSDVGNPRTWEILRPGGPESPLIGRRLLLWDKGLTLLAERPLWGWGPQGFIDAPYAVSAATSEQVVARYGSSQAEMILPELTEENAHNYFLQYAVEFGVAGLIALLVLIGAIFWTAVDGLRHCTVRETRGELLGTLSGLAGVLALSVVSHPLLLAEIQALFWVLAAYAAAVAIAGASEDRGEGPSEDPGGPAS